MRNHEKQGIKSLCDNKLADQVLLLYRDDYYKPENDFVSTFEIIVAKNRDGEIGKILLQYDTNTQLIYE